MSKTIMVATLVSALGCGLAAGVFFAFSSFVMPGLARLPAAQGIAAMQAINVTALTRWFMTALVGTAILCLLLAIASVATWSLPGSGFRLAGGILYIAGAIAVTRAFNIPRNDALAASVAESAEGAAVWARYMVEWTAWNHVRVIACLVASALMILAYASRP